MLHLEEAGLIRIFTGGIFSPSLQSLYVFENIVYIDQDYDNHQADKKIIHLLFFYFFINTGSCYSSQNSAQYHQHKKNRRKSWNLPCQNRTDQTGQLRKQDNIQRILGCLLRIHRKEPEQHHQIYRSASYPKKSRHNAQHHSNQDADSFTFHPVGFYFVLLQSINQRPQRDN